MSVGTDQRVVFLDVDGTLIDHAGRMSPGTAGAIAAARANGHVVLLSTGRALAEIPEVVQAIAVDGTITAAGGFAVVGDTLVAERTMPAATLRRLTDHLRDGGHEFLLQSRDSLWATPGARARFVAGLGDGHLPGAMPVDEGGTAGPMPVEGVAKAVFLGEGQDAFDEVVRGIGDEFTVITGTIPHLGTGAGEIAPRGVTKGAAIVDVLEHLGVPAAQAIGIGDNVNDIEMFDVCGVGIAMGNASDEIKALADEVTASVLDDAILLAFERHGLV